VEQKGRLGNARENASILATLILYNGTLNPAWETALTTTLARIPASGGEVVLATESDRKYYDSLRFAAARRAGDVLYISGVIVGRMKDEGNDVAAFKDQVRRAFRRIETTLKAAGAGFADVTMINSFHVFNSPNFAGTRDEQFAAFGLVKDEFMSAPHPAWTAVGTTGLLIETGIVEVQMIAHVPTR
jgi:enamine deaminase RidA (YjgF/YER057c/UK114 family)